MDFAGREIQYRYDRLGRRIATRYPDNHELHYHYDDTGQQKGPVTRHITAKGYQDYHYDINGRFTQKVVHQHGFRSKTWYYQWNTLNQLIACFNPEGECWRYTYNTWGRSLSKNKVVDNRPTPSLNSRFKNKRVQRDIPEILSI